MNIIDNEQVNHLIEVHEIVAVVVHCSIDKLCLEFMSCNIKHHLVLETLLSLDADSLSQVRLAKARAAVDKQRVE